MSAEPNSSVVQGNLYERCTAVVRRRNTKHQPTSKTSEMELAELESATNGLPSDRCKQLPTMRIFVCAPMVLIRSNRDVNPAIP